MWSVLHRFLATPFVAAAYPATPPLPDEAAAELGLAARSSETLGELIYEGTVRPRDSDNPPLFRYERRVLDLDAGLLSSHMTFSLEGEPAVLHRAEHSAAYELTGFREIHAQAGLVGQVLVDLDGTATFTTTVEGTTRTRVEAPGDPLHVGPTLFGYVRMNWDSLMAGEPHPIRFVVLEKRRSYRFTLQAVEDQPGPTFEMKATSPLVRLAVPTPLLVFDERRNIVRYSGLVPPLEEVGGRLKKLDATVTYALNSNTYR